MRLNKPLAVAYYMKEDLRQLWSRANKAQAKRFLKDWIARAEASGIKMLKSFAKTLREHQAGILAYYNFRISRPFGRNEQQDQDDEAGSIRLS